MEKKLLKVFRIMIILILVILSFALYNKVNAYVIIDNPDQYNAQPSSSKLSDAAGGIVGAIQTVGVVVSVLTLSIVGIKYMLTSPGEKAEYKSAMIPYIVGAVLTFAGATLVNIIYTLIH